MWASFLELLQAAKTYKDTEEQFTRSHTLPVIRISNVTARTTAAAATATTTATTTITTII